MKPTVLAAALRGGPIMLDRIVTAPNAAAVIDGATDPANVDGRLTERYVDTLAANLRAALTEPLDLRNVLHAAIARTSAALDLGPGLSPSATLAIARWTDTDADVLVLGDCTAALVLADGSARAITDRRLATVAPRLREQYRADLRAGHGFGTQHTDTLRRLVDIQRQHRNRPGGFWVAEADPQAAEHALVAPAPRERLRAVVLATDGVSLSRSAAALPEPTWAAFHHAALTVGVGRLLAQQHDAEATDPDGARWPRSKRHDDKAAAVIDFTAPAASRCRVDL